MDFTDLPVRNKTYSGANGGKISVIWNGELYMIKFPGIPQINKNMSYANGCISEYIGCHIFEIIGIPVQKTFLGTYNVNEKEKIVVACKDFATGGLVLQDFASLKNTIIDTEHNGYGTDLNDVISAINEQTAIDSEILSSRFWDMFIVDALIGNWDRHNGNWGFLYNTITDEIELAPVYDCGSCLYPQADEAMMKNILENQAERDIRIFERPLSCLKINNQKIQYFRLISSLEYRQCNEALKRIVPRIDMGKIDYMIDKTPYISEIQRDFYKTMLHERKKKILDYSLEKLISRR